jgi:hypothetical protein
MDAELRRSFGREMELRRASHFKRTVGMSHATLKAYEAPLPRLPSLGSPPHGSNPASPQHPAYHGGGSGNQHRQQQQQQQQLEDSRPRTPKTGGAVAGNGLYLSRPASREGPVSPGQRR